MFSKKHVFRRPLTQLLAFLMCAALAVRTVAADPVPVSENVTVNLINRLVERGVITRQDADELLKQAEKDAAMAHMQAAAEQDVDQQVAAAKETAAIQIAAAEEAAAKKIAAAKEVAAIQVAAAREIAAIQAAAKQTPAATGQVATVQAAASAPALTAPSASAPAAPAASTAPEDDTVRVTYVPEIVKAQLRDEIKTEVLAQARQEHWAAPNALPSWISRFTPFGDIRIRYEGSYYYPTGNSVSFASSYWNFNGINTASTPYDYTQLGFVNPPFPNVQVTRTRVRLRARLGTAVDLGDGFTSGFRLATGENDSPVTENQSLGAANSAQGGNFSKYAIWLDRAFLKYEIGGLPDKDLAVSIGRFDNPFFATSMIWADDLGFDGIAAQGKYPINENLTPFFTAGVFPVFNTDFNFATNQPSKFKSEDKWLYAAQVGADWEVTQDVNLKVGGAYYFFKNIEGKVSTPFIPLNSQDAGSTDDTRPAFAQRGNTYIALRNIIPDPTLNVSDSINQWQYFGLATPFHELAFTARLDYNHFEPFQVSLSGEYVKNLAFHRDAIVLNGPPQFQGPVNNNSPTSDTFGGGNAAWIVNFKVGKVALAKRWDWNINLNYRDVESDSVVDGFVDSDFGGGGTNLKGYTVAGALALSSHVWLGVRWMTAEAIAGPPYKNDLLQCDLNAKF